MHLAFSQLQGVLNNLWATFLWDICSILIVSVCFRSRTDTRQAQRSERQFPILPALHDERSSRQSSAFRQPPIFETLTTFIQWYPLVITRFVNTFTGVVICRQYQSTAGRKLRDIIPQTDKAPSRSGTELVSYLDVQKITSAQLQHRHL
jgi:hypothetical protein